MEFEVDQFGDFNLTISNGTNDNNPSSSSFMPKFWFFNRELIKVLVSISAIICDVLIIYAAVKLKRLGEPKYFYLTSWAALNIGYCVLAPYVSLMLWLERQEEGITRETLCALLQVEASFALLIYLVVFLLTIDWIADNFLPRPCSRNYYRTKHVFVRIALGVVVVLCVFYDALYCLMPTFENLRHSRLLVGLILLVTHLTAVHIFRIVYNWRRHGAAMLWSMDLGLEMATVFVVSWVPCLLVHFLPNGESVSLFLAECLVLGNSILNVWLVARREPEFRKEFQGTVKWQWRHDGSGNGNTDDGDKNGKT